MARWHTRIRRFTTVAAAAAVTFTDVAIAPISSAEVPTVPDPVTYQKYQPILDPGAGSPGYFQPRWYDTEGRHIQAHGGQIVTATQLGVDPGDVVGGTQADGTPIFYWYGEDRSNDYYNGPGASVYSSTDTFNWKNEGVAMRSVTSRDELKTAYFDALYDTVDDSDIPRDDVIDGLPDRARVRLAGVTRRVQVRRPVLHRHLRNHRMEPQPQHLLLGRFSAGPVDPWCRRQ